ncbi:nif-specific transcriptional activator NifA [Azospira inquinata]|uniref:Nif-specific regulatory protein n=1 Tax=Azospira inquinata TaxID=2785627 RepID=A0A975SPP7_9RHOO|nr:nif-specific transcriptional activator NifA [Azospira inquinata]QWT47204.1 nif-specific transcriptional activator NifA [Azospira inquinata]QWT50168.1 nif-specific transcriptional activator NifA [Azospira inquinata]
MATELADRSADLELVTIYEISKILTASLDFQRAVRETLNVMLTHLGMQHGVVSLVQEEGKLHVVGAAGVPFAEDEDIVLDTETGVAGQIIRTGSPMVVPDITRDSLFVNRTGRDLSRCVGVALIAVPIKDNREIIGILSVDRPPDTQGPIGFDRDVRLLTLVAGLMSQTLKLHRAIAAEREQLILDTHRLQKQLQSNYDVENVIGRSRRMKEVFADVHQAAPGNSTILLRGESGTGKEAIAHAIHYLSPRAKGPFIKVNCAALPETLLESELFGHEKGAFTGATSERKGRFEMADGGSLFLDEIGDVSPSFQAKLLRVLQEHEFERVGGNKTLKANFRLVAATNRNLEEMVQKGDFRADLYFRLNVVAIFLPALRERKEDIPLLVDFFLTRFNRENGRKLAMSPGALEILLQCNWPGNVRELENCVERAATMTRGAVIREVDMRCQKGQCFSSVLLESASTRACHPIIDMSHGGPAGAPSFPTMPSPPPMGMPPVAGEGEAADGDLEVLEGENNPLFMSERDRIVDAMEKCGWVQAKAARMLNLTPRQIGYALKKYNIEVKRL